MSVEVHRDEENFFLKDVDVFGPLPHAIETLNEIAIPFFIAIVVRYRCIKEAGTRNVCVQKEKNELDK
jgi:hypothetical protein